MAKRATTKKRPGSDRDRRIASKRAAGKTVRDIAKEEGISPSAVSAAARREGALIARLTEEKEEQLCKLHQLALDGIEADLQNTKASVRQDAQVIALKYLVAAAKLKAQQAQTTGDFTLTQVMMVAMQGAAS